MTFYGDTYIFCIFWGEVSSFLLLLTNSDEGEMLAVKPQVGGVWCGGSYYYYYCCCYSTCGRVRCRLTSISAEETNKQRQRGPADQSVYVTQSLLLHVLNPDPSCPDVLVM